MRTASGNPSQLLCRQVEEGEDDGEECRWSTRDLVVQEGVKEEEGCGQEGCGRCLAGGAGDMKSERVWKGGGPRGDDAVHRTRLGRVRVRVE
jgi:hypothetical protein